jgi:DNA-binding CsgD family transcriptional regulator/PAS domain-containing protein
VGIQLTPEIISSVISDIYDCAVDPGHWPIALTRITAITNAAYCAISVAEVATRRAVHTHCSPWDVGMLMKLNAEYAHEIPGGMEIAMGDADIARSTMEMMPEAEFQKTRFYREWVGPQNLRDGCLAKFVDTRGLVGLFSLITRADRDVITAEERRFINLICPHLRRAALIGDMLNQSAIATSMFRSALERLSTPVILLDGYCRVISCNSAAEEIINNQKSVAIQQAVFGPTAPARKAAFADAVLRAAADDGISLGGRGIGVPISASGDVPLVAYIMPLRRGSVRDGEASASVAVFISGAAQHIPPPATLLMTLFELTQAEARVALRISAGDNIPEAAVALAISENTVKTQLAAIYAKTGTSRQTELTRLVRELAL